jgi:hypothetical protein
MSSVVTVTGTPTLTLNDGGTATYKGGTGTNALTFNYTVGSGDANVSALAANAVNLPGGATIKDSSGNSASLALTGLAQSGPQIDTIAPTVSSVVPSGTGITAGAGDLGAGSLVTLTVNLSDPVTVTGTPTLSLNDGGTATYKGGTGTNALTFSYTVASSDSAVSALAITGVHLPSGAIIKDAAGNAANLSGAVTTFSGLKTDPLGPAPPVISSFSPDTGVAGDGITNNNTLTLSGTAVANSTVTVFDGTTQIGTATANGSGTWTFKTAALADGSHKFTATDAGSGATSAAPSALSVTVDTHVPAAPVLVGDTVVNTNQVLLTGTAEANSTVKVFDGTTLVGTTTAGATGNWSVTTGALTNGTHSLVASAIDAAGNTSAQSQPLAPVIGSPAPGAPTIASFSPDTGVVGDGITDHNTLTLTGTAAANSTVKIFDGSALIGTTTANANGSWDYITAILSDARHILTAKATDASSQTSASSSALSVTVDTHVPDNNT